MGVSCDYMDDGPDFYSEAFPRAKKTHKCAECDQPINPGEVYASCTGKWEGEVSTTKQHLRCYHLCRAANSVYGECTIPFHSLDIWALDGDHWWDQAWIDLAPATAEIFGSRFTDKVKDEVGSFEGCEGWAGLLDRIKEGADWAKIEEQSRAYAPTYAPPMESTR